MVTKEKSTLPGSWYQLICGQNNVLPQGLGEADLVLGVESETQVRQKQEVGWRKRCDFFRFFG